MYVYLYRFVLLSVYAIIYDYSTHRRIYLLKRFLPLGAAALSTTRGPGVANLRRQTHGPAFCAAPALA